MFHIVQEALRNVVKHVPAGRVRIDVRDGPAGTRIEVRDDGGRAPGPLAATGAGAGLSGMRERVAALGGVLSARPREDGGWPSSRSYLRRGSQDAPVGR